MMVAMAAASNALSSAAATAVCAIAHSAKRESWRSLCSLQVKTTAASNLCTDALDGAPPPTGNAKKRSSPSREDGVERQVAHSSTEAAWLYVASWLLAVGS